MMLITFLFSFSDTPATYKICVFCFSILLNVEAVERRALNLLFTFTEFIHSLKACTSDVFILTLVSPTYLTLC